jgi:hypothetical protein
VAAEAEAVRKAEAEAEVARQAKEAAAVVAAEAEAVRKAEAEAEVARQAKEGMLWSTLPPVRPRETAGRPRKKPKRRSA